MAEDLRLYKARERGSKAQSLLDDPFFNEALEELRAELLKEWEKTEPPETEAREDIYRQMNLVASIKAYFGRLAANGRLADAEIEREAEQERKRNG